MKKKRKKKGNILLDILWKMVFLAALAVFCYCGYRLITIYMEYKRGTDEYSALEQQYANLDNSDKTETDSTYKAATDAGMTEAEEARDLDEEPLTEAGLETEIVEDEEGRQIVKTYPRLKNPIDFKSLQAVNEDIIGWIRINGLDISYPIAQGDDNDYYLHRTFEREENFAGCIFMEFQNHSDFSDKNTIIYGHNMKNGSMFGKLKNYYEEGVFESASYFWIYTPDKIYKYDIFSCSQVGSRSDTYQITFSTDEDFLAYIDNAFSHSVVENDGITVGAEDKIVTLSTCTGNEETRFAVQGKLSKIYKAVNP